jgi:hypothetical protein
MENCAAVDTSSIEFGLKYVDMAVKFWGPNRVQADMENVPPNFIYYVTNMFPKSVPLYSAKMMPSVSDLTRTATFAFNDILVLRILCRLGKLENEPFVGWT